MIFLTNNMICQKDMLTLSLIISTYAQINAINEL